MAVVQVAASLTVLAHPRGAGRRQRLGPGDGVGCRRAGRQRQPGGVAAVAGPSDAGARAMGRRIVPAWAGGDRRRATPARTVASVGRSAPAGQCRGRVCVRDLDRGRALHVAMALAYRWMAACGRARRGAGRRDAGGVSQRRPLAGRCRRPAWIGGLRHRRARGGALAVGARHRPARRAGADAWGSGPHRRRGRGDRRLRAVDLRRGSRARARATTEAAGARTNPPSLLGTTRRGETCGRSAARTCVCGTRHHPTGSARACATTTRS